MKKSLEELSDKELKNVANRLMIYGYEDMDKKELIKNILISSGDSKEIEKDIKDKRVKPKRLKREIMFHIMFISFIFISIIISASILINRFYFYPKIFHTQNKDIGGLSLTILSSLFSGYIYYRWLKFRVLNLFMIFSSLLSIAWFIYGSVNDYQNILKPYYAIRDNPFAKLFNTDIIKSFEIYFYTVIGLVSLLSLLSASMFLLRI